MAKKKSEGSAVLNTQLRRKIRENEKTRKALLWAFVGVLGTATLIPDVRLLGSVFAILIFQMIADLNQANRTYETQTMINWEAD